VTAAQPKHTPGLIDDDAAQPRRERAFFSKVVQCAVRRNTTNLCYILGFGEIMQN
jgi:hypothetical protein